MTTEQQEAPKVAETPSGGDAPKAEAQPSPARPPFMTEAQAIAELTDFVRRAEASNLSPMALLVRVGWRRGVGMLDGYLAGVEDSLSANKGKKA